MQRYVTRRIEETADLVIRRLGHEPLRTALRRELDEVVEERMSSRAWGERYAEACPVEGALPPDYHLRELTLEQDLSVLAGIHFLGGDRREPFVGVFAPSRRLERDEIRSGTDRLLEAFDLFGPSSVRWWSALAEPDLRALPGARGDQRLVGGWLRELEVPAGSEDLELRPEETAEPFEAYRRIYADLLRDEPDRGEWIREATLEEIEECARAGGLVTVRRAGSMCGLVAARPGRLRGIPCWEMVEEILDASLRGRGLAASIQGRFLQLLDPEREGLVLGAIDDRNQPSYRTALGVGRHDLGGWVFVAG